MAVTPISLRQFLPLVLPVAARCPEPVATFNLRLAAIEFCERTLCWRHVTDQVMTGNSPVIVAPAYATIHKFEHVRFGDADLTPIAYTDVDQGDLSGSGFPHYVTQVDDNAVTVLPYQNGTLHLSMFLKPRQGQDFANPDTPGIMQDYYDQVPDFLLHQHGEVIAEGALARIYDHPDAVYYDPRRAAIHRDRFDRRAISLFSRYQRGQQRAPIRTTTQWF